MARRQFMHEDGFPCEPTDIGEDGWYYVDSKGLHIISGKAGGLGHIPWAKVKRALRDRELAPSRRKKPRNAM
jgi:hypothetical protein